MPHFLEVLLIAINAILISSFKIHSVSSQGRTSRAPIPDEFVNATISRTKGIFMELKLKSRTIKLLNVPDVMQATQYTCGPSSLSAVLSFYDLVHRQSELARLAKTDPEFGTGPRNLLAAVKALNISAELVQRISTSDLESYLFFGRPVIVQIQAWGDEGTNYTIDFDDGHYVVAIGFDDHYYYFEDPWILGSIGYIPKKDFEARWHDYVNSEQRKVYNIGIIVQAPFADLPVIVELQ